MNSNKFYDVNVACKAPVSGMAHALGASQGIAVSAFEQIALPVVWHAGLPKTAARAFRVHNAHHASVIRSRGRTMPR